MSIYDFINSPDIPMSCAGVEKCLILWYNKISANGEEVLK